MAICVKAMSRCMSTSICSLSGGTPKVVGASALACTSTIHKHFRHQSRQVHSARLPAVVDARQYQVSEAASSQLVAHEIIKGALAKWCIGRSDIPIPTAVIVHGILGNKRNLTSFAKMLLREHPSWQVLMVDLRNHGESAATTTLPGPHTVDTAAEDILRLLRHLKLFPTMLVGHSFGGKVVLSMVDQFGANLPKPVHVWVLDALPGALDASSRQPNSDGVVEDHPGELIETLKGMRLPIKSRMHCVDELLSKGFSESVARWVSTNLRPIDGRFSNKLLWTFDLDGIAEMYKSYESKELWPLLERRVKGLTIDFVKADQSAFRWDDEDEARIQKLGHGVHLLRKSGHWVHTDNPHGLLDIVESSFSTRTEVVKIEEYLQESLDGGDDEAWDLFNNANGKSKLP